MDIPLDQFGRRQVVPAPLDWPGLAARLAAAHAARQMLTAGYGPADPSGSFAPDIAHDLAGWRAPSSPGVNLTPKADGKPPRAIARNDAGHDRSIVRGRL